MPRIYPLFVPRSKPKVNNTLEICLKSNNTRSNQRPSPSSASISTNNSNRKEIPPHRLRDNLHWRCSTCNALVTTSETGAHLINCLIDIVGPFFESGLVSNPLTSQRFDVLSLPASMQSTTAQQQQQATIQRRSDDRPRTKKLERPTPNIRHPIINDTTFEADDDNNNNANESISSNGNFCSCRKLTMNANKVRCIPENEASPLNSTKCNLNQRTVTSNKVISLNRNTGWSSGGVKVYPPPPPAPPPTASITTTTIVPNAEKKVCNSCERSSAPERLHSHRSANHSYHINSHHHHHHHQHQNQTLHNRHTRVNSSLKKEPSVTKEQSINNTKTISSSSPQRLPSKDKDYSNRLHKSSTLQQDNNAEEEEKDYENGSNENNLLHEIGKQESPDLNNTISYSSLCMKCYLCRQEFGTDEIETHEIECLEKWKHDTANLSPNQRVPMASNTQENDHRGSFSSITGCDPAGWEHFKSQLTPCPKCGRTFFPHRLAAHEKACLGPQAGKRSKNTAQAQTNVVSESVDGETKVHIKQYNNTNNKPIRSQPSRVGQFSYNNKHA